VHLELRLSKVNRDAEVRISGSKSETNRLLLLQSMFPQIILENPSDSDDSKAMQNALQSQNPIIDIHHAGTAMRFLTAYFAIRENRTVTLTGSDRMKKRPIKILVDALRQLGAEIDYLENDGFPPLKITGKKITKNQVSLKADVSSQYISALLLIAPKLENGLELTLEGEITSIPYIKMTLALLEGIGVKTSFKGNTIGINSKFHIAPPVRYRSGPNSKVAIESDWSSASYYYSIIALSETGTQIRLSTFKKHSLQGDSTVTEIYKNFGVETVFENDSIVLTKKAACSLQSATFHLQNNPDLAQTIAVTAFGLGLGCTLTGLHTLKIKETDRLEALKTELTKLGAKISITPDSLTLQKPGEINPNVSIKTYSDHRMAMAFAPLALKAPIVIENAEVVSKSYPNFWEDLKKIGFAIGNIA
jgi:3-phosphoshikimate 1-carboxyvinyltransferase